MICVGGGIARYNSWTFLILAIVFLLMGKISNFQYFFIFIAGVIVTVICRRYDMKMDYSKENIVLKFKNIAPVLLFCIISLVICVPGELYLNNLNEFPIAPIPYILTLLIIAVVFWGIYVVGASFFLNMRQVKYFARVIFAVTLCGYVQRMFLNGHMRQMDGITSTAVYSTKSTINIIFWMLMLIVIVFIDIIMHRNIDKVYRVISIYIVLVEVVSVGYMVFSSKNLADVQKNWESDCTKLTWNGLCELSPNDNVVVFVLDWFDGQFMEKILSEEEEFLDPLEDFTYYTNTTSMYAYTGMSVPYLLSGTEWKYNMTDDEYAEYAFQDSNLLSDIVDAGVDARVFTDSKHLGYSIRNRLNNGEKIYPHVDIFNTLCIMTNCARYQMAPFVYKHCFYYTDNDLQQMVEDNSRTFYLPNDDKKVMDTFTESGLYLSNESKGAFRFYHLCGAHQEEKKDMIPMAKYSMEIVFWYIDQLKKLGLYDDATIIITADHGQNCLFDPSGQDDMEELNLEPTSNPILFVKEPNSDNESIVYSRAPVSHKEVVSEVMYAINSEQNRYGEILSDVGEDEERERIFIFNRGDMPYVKAVINGNVRRSGSWTIIEKIPLDKK